MEKQRKMNIQKMNVQSYMLTILKFKFTVNEKRILSFIVNNLQFLVEGKNLKGKVQRNFIGDYLMEFSLSELAFDSQTNYQRIKMAILSLNEKFFYLETDILWRPIRLIEMPKIENREKVKFYLSNELVDIFLDFRKGFKKFELQVSLSLSSVYSMRLYELFCGQTKPIIYTIEYLKTMFNIENKYSRDFDFIKYVIVSAKKELDEKSPDTFEYELIKQGRKVQAIKFYPISNVIQKDAHIERKELIKKVSLGWEFEKIEREYLYDMGFSDREIKNNYDVFLQAKKQLPDFLNELAILKAKCRGKHTPKGYIINVLKGKVQDILIKN